MPFSERAKTIALAIVKIFETSEPFGRYDAVAVLDDGAGISYGTSQFTHKSGSLYAVLNRYMELGGRLSETIGRALPDFKSKTKILARSNDKAVKTALKTLGQDALMQQAQREIAFENYLKPALDACDGSNFTLPLSLAVIYDSMNHGSYGKIRDRVQLELPASIKPIEYEKEWIEEYVAERHKWLNSVSRLKKTAYRTDFFINQIDAGNWNLGLPLNVHGFLLTEAVLFPTGTKDSATAINSQSSSLETQQGGVSGASENTPSPINEKEWTEGERPTMNVENIEKANIEAPKIPPQTSPVTVTAERVSIFAKIGAAFTAITALGINLGNVSTTKLNELSPQQIVWLVGACLLIASALWFYDRAAKRAHEKTLAKMKTASDPAQNTVELREQK